MIGLYVDNGIVINSAKWDVLPEGWIEAPEFAGIGWIYADGIFTKPEKPVLVATQSDYISAAQLFMDQEAGKLGYDSIFTAVGYVSSSHPVFGPEGIAFRDWRDSVWDKCFEILSLWEAGGEQPTISDVIDSLPLFMGP